MSPKKPISKESRSDVSNYRPISFLGIPGKLLESQICYNIDNHLKSSDLLSKSQWGFTKGRSTEGMLLSMTERWKIAMDIELTVGVIFINFQKAFDTVSHNFLSMKLHAIGISGNLHTWLMSCLKTDNNLLILMASNHLPFLLNMAYHRAPCQDQDCTPFMLMTFLIL